MIVSLISVCAPTIPFGHVQHTQGYILFVSMALHNILELKADMETVPVSFIFCSSVKVPHKRRFCKGLFVCGSEDFECCLCFGILTL